MNEIRNLHSVRNMLTLALAASLLVLAGCHARQHTTLTISAAASMKESLAEVESAYLLTHPGVDFHENYGSSGALVSQVEQGAPVDVFLSASSKPMNELESKGLLVAGSRSNLLRNSLVLIVPRDSRLQDLQGLTSNTVRVIALGDPASVPAGQYGRQTLVSLQLLDKIKSKIVLAKDVRQVLAYVETGNADAGLVYATDAMTSSKVRVVMTVPEAAHDAIVYPVAVLKGRPSEAASHQFVEFLATPAAQAIFQKHGFTVAAK